MTSSSENNSFTFPQICSVNVIVINILWQGSGVDNVSAYQHHYIKILQYGITQSLLDASLLNNTQCQTVFDLINAQCI